MIDKNSASGFLNHQSQFFNLQLPRGGDGVNLFVADPHWGVWIVLYFYLGGIAAGAYLLAVLLEWLGNADDARVARVAHVIAFPLVAVCLLLLVIDLGRP